MVLDTPESAFFPSVIENCFFEIAKANRMELYKSVNEFCRGGFFFSTHNRCPNIGTVPSFVQNFP